MRFKVSRDKDDFGQALHVDWFNKNLLPDAYSINNMIKKKGKKGLFLEALNTPTPPVTSLLTEVYLPQSICGTALLLHHYNKMLSNKGQEDIKNYEAKIMQEIYKDLQDERTNIDEVTGRVY